jgi:hypothetical protein
MDFFDLRTIAMLHGSLVLLLAVVFVVDTYRGPTAIRRSKDRRRNGTIPFNPADLRIFS